MPYIMEVKYFYWFVVIFNVKNTPLNSQYKNQFYITFERCFQNEKKQHKIGHSKKRTSLSKGKKKNLNLSIYVNNQIIMNNEIPKEEESMNLSHNRSSINQENYENTIRSPLIGSQKFETFIDQQSFELKSELGFEEYNNKQNDGHQINQQEPQSHKNIILVKGSKVHKKNRKKSQKQGSFSHESLKKSQISEQSEEEKQTSEYSESSQYYSSQDDESSSFSKGSSDISSGQLKGQRRTKKKISKQNEQKNFSKKSSKNILKAFKSRIINYIKKNQTETCAFLNQLSRKDSTLADFQILFQMDIYKSTLQKMFSNRHLKREVMLGNIKDLEKIKLYLKKVKVFQQGFEKGKLPRIM